MKRSVGQAPGSNLFPTAPSGMTSHLPFHPRLLPLVAVALPLVACKGDGDGGGSNRIRIPAGTDQAVRSATFDLLLEGNDLLNASVRSDLLDDPLVGFAYDGDVFVLGIPLEEGPNVLEVEGTFDGGSSSRETLTVTRLPADAPPVRLDVLPAIGEGPVLETVFSLSLGDNGSDPVRVYLDLDGDGVFDEDRPHAPSLTVALQHPGPFKPSVTLRLEDDRIVSSPDYLTPLVSILPVSPADPDLAVAGLGAEPTEIEPSPAGDGFFVLDAATPAVRKLDWEGNLLLERNLPDLTNPQGFAVDQDENLYIADTGGDRVLKLVRATGYQPDPLFPFNGFLGGPGAGPGQLSGPTDVAVSGTGLDQRIYVADPGNARVQQFNRAGVFLQEIGNQGPSPELAEPIRLEATGAGVMVLDRATQQLCRFSDRGVCLAVRGGQGTAPGQFREASGLSSTPDGRWLVSDRGNARVQLLSRESAVDRVIASTEGAPLGALYIPMFEGPRLFVLPEGQTILQGHQLTTDPPGTGPVDVVQIFVDSVASGDWEAARDLVISGRREIVDAIAQSPEASQEATDRAQQFSPPALARHTGWEALVTVADGGAELEFLLRRDPRDGVWSLASF